MTVVVEIQSVDRSLWTGAVPGVPRPGDAVALPGSSGRERWVVEFLIWDLYVDGAPRLIVRVKR